MGMNLSAAGALAKKDLLESVQAVQGPHSVAAKIQNKKIEKPERQEPPIALNLFSKSEVKQISERFEPIQPVLQKALVGNQILRKEFQDIERLTQPRSESQVQRPAVVSAASHSTESKPPMNGKVVKIQETRMPVALSVESLSAPHGTSVSTATASRPAQGIVVSPRPLPPPPVKPPQTETNVNVIRSVNHPAVNVAVQPPAGEARRPFVGNVPVKPVTTEIQSPSKPVQTRPIVQAGEGTVQVSKTPPMVSRPQNVTITPAPPKLERGAMIPSRTETKINESVSTPRPVGEVKAAIAPLGHSVRIEAHSPSAPVIDSRRLNESRDLTKESIVQSIFSPKVLSPQTTVEITKSNQTSTTVTLQSSTSAPRPVVSIVGDALPSPRLIAERNRLSFDRNLKAGGIQNFVAVARQTVLLHEVQPLPPQVSALEGHIAQPVLTNPPETGLKTETVARNPLREDNRSQVTNLQGPKESNDSPVSKPVEKTAPRIGENPVPPLSNLDRLRRILPTNVKSRLTPVPAVNILDLVL